MKDEILEELWKSKDKIAKEHNHNMDKLVTSLRKNEKKRKIKVINLSRTAEKCNLSHP